MATVVSHKKLFTYYQCNGVDYQEFTLYYGTLETHGGIGAIGITPAFSQQSFRSLPSMEQFPVPLTLLTLNKYGYSPCLR